MMPLYECERFALARIDDCDLDHVNEIAGHWMSAINGALKELSRDTMIVDHSAWGCWTTKRTLPLYVSIKLSNRKEYSAELDICREIDRGTMLLTKLQAIKDDVTAMLVESKNQRSQEFSGLLDLLLLEGP